jgi:hypothetical protein
VTIFSQHIWFLSWTALHILASKRTKMVHSWHLYMQQETISATYSERVELDCLLWLFIIVFGKYSFWPTFSRLAVPGKHWQDIRSWNTELVWCWSYGNYSSSIIFSKLFSFNFILLLGDDLRASECVRMSAYLLTYLLTHSLHGAESLRS